MFVIPETTEARMGFFYAMQSFRATYLWQILPRPVRDTSCAILLPKSEPRSAKVAAVLREAKVFDLSSYLQALVAQQTDRMKAPQ